MKPRSVTASVLRTMLLFISIIMYGCGGGSGNAVQPTPTEKVLFSNGASVSIADAGNGNYLVQGDNLQDVAGLDITLRYDSSAMSAPAVAKGDLMSGALFASNTNTPGVIRLALVGATGISGTGPISALSFTLARGGVGTIFLDTVTMLDSQGHEVR